MDVTKVGDKNSVKETNQETRVQGTQTTKTKSAQTSQTKKVPQQNVVERVNWSPDADLIAEGVQAAKTSGDVNAEKIAVLKAKVRSGQYQMDASKIADKMIQSSLEEDLLTRKS